MCFKEECLMSSMIGEKSCVEAGTARMPDTEEYPVFRPHVSYKVYCATHNTMLRLEGLVGLVHAKPTSLFRW